MAYDYQLFVIGAGSGGVRAARMSAQYGAKTVIAEEYRIGGTCVIRGCVPKKLFVYASHFAEEFSDAASFGWQLDTPRFNWPTLLANKDKEIARLEKIYQRNLDAAGVDIIQERAELLDAHTIKIGDRRITAEYILIATGSTPFMPDIAGKVHAISSNEAFYLDSLPSHITIAGGGYIAVEFAGIFNGLGVDVTLVHRGDKILRGFDDDIRSHLQAEMAKKGVEIRLNTQIAAIEKTTKGFDVRLSDDSTQTTGQVMIATGRKPNIAGLGLEKVGVKLTDDGRIAVDAFSRTNIKNIFAVGDVSNRVQLTPIAIREGAAFAETIFNNNPQKIDQHFIPMAVFSQPSVGTVGLTEEEARETHEVDIYKSVFRPLKHTLSGSEEKTLVKLLVDKKTDKILGVHIVGADSAEVIQAIGIAVTMGATKAQFDATIAVHPTMAEEIVTMRQKEEG